MHNGRIFGRRGMLVHGSFKRPRTRSDDAANVRNQVQPKLSIIPKSKLTSPGLARADDASVPQTTRVLFSPTFFALSTIDVTTRYHARVKVLHLDWLLLTQPHSRLGASCSAEITFVVPS